jgi:very-short-patch-repair endonuclease
MKRNNIGTCRTLRRNQTDAEKKLWAVLRNRKLAGIKFRRQFPVGSYILDFYAPEYGLGIEADGGQHYEDRNKQQDEVRTRELSKLGVEIIRFSDRDILTNIEGICETIESVLKKKGPTPPHLDPLPFGERKGKNKASTSDV